VGFLSDVGRRLRPDDAGRATRAVWQATWHDAVLAESDQTIVVEGNHCFPADSVRRELLHPSASHTVCAWKGIASYYDVVVDDQVNRDAAWYYPDPSRAAERIRGRVAFWHGVKVQQRPQG
jgi:uncharacterized protein (DUF427 family)